MGKATQDVYGKITNVPWKINDSGIDDNDLNKPVKLVSSDTVALCSDGDQIYGFINSVEQRTQDGKTIVGIQDSGRVWVQLSGASSFGALVEAGANAAAGTANSGTKKAIVSTHSYDTTDVASLAGSLVDKAWKIISGTFSDGDTVLIEKQ